MNADCKPTIHANLMALSFMALELLAIEVTAFCGNRHFRLFCSCDLNLDPATFIYKPDPYFLEIYWICKYELTLFDRHTDIHDPNYIPRRCTDGQQSIINN